MATAKKKPAIDLAADAASIQPTNQQMSEVSKMCDAVKKIQVQIEEATTKLSQLTGLQTKLVEVDIPEAMKAIGMKSFTLDDGRVVAVEVNSYPSYSNENEAAVFAWLRKNGHESIIKNVLNVRFGKGDDAKAAALEKFIMSKKFSDWEKKESIHAGTFKAFVREQLAEGKKLPKQIAIFDKSIAVIKEPKNGSQVKTSSGKASVKGSSVKAKDLF